MRLGNGLPGVSGSAVITTAAGLSAFIGAKLCIAFFDVPPNLAAILSWPLNALEFLGMVFVLVGVVLIVKSLRLNHAQFSAAIIIDVAAVLLGSVLLAMSALERIRFRGASGRKFESVPPTNQIITGY